MTEEQLSAGTMGRTDDLEGTFLAVLDGVLEAANQRLESDSPQRSAERILDAIVVCQPQCAVGLRVTIDNRELIVRRSNQQLGPAASPKEDRLFDDPLREIAIALPGVRSGTLHYASTCLLSDDRPPQWLDRCASVMALTLGPASGGTEAIAPPVGQLAQLHKLADVGKTTAEVVHEISNPLTAIITYADSLGSHLQNGPAGAAELDRLAKIQHAARRIQAYCRNLTGYSRPPAADTRLLNMREVLDRALAFCEHDFQGKSITIERHYLDIPEVEGVDSALTQVFVNLVTNAQHAMAGGPGTLSLRTEHRAGQVLIEVADEGHGIAAENIDQIFESYFSTKAVTQGVGLGLHIARRIIEQHGGQISADNRDPVGTVFYVWLPAAS